MKQLAIYRDNKIAVAYDGEDNAIFFMPFY